MTTCCYYVFFARQVTLPIFYVWPLYFLLKYIKVARLLRMGDVRQCVKMFAYDGLRWTSIETM